MKDMEVGDFQRDFHTSVIGKLPKSALIKNIIQREEVKKGMYVNLIINAN